MAKRNLGMTVGKAASGAATGAAKATKSVAKATRGAARATKSAASGAARLAKDGPAASPNPMTNLIITDIALRSGGQLMRHALERTLLGVRYTDRKAKDIVKGRSMAQTLIGTAVARIAMRSVPGAILVGGGLLAKTLYDRSKDRRAAEAEGQAAVDKQADDT